MIINFNFRIGSKIVGQQHDWYIDVAQFIYLQLANTEIG